AVRRLRGDSGPVSRGGKPMNKHEAFMRLAIALARRVPDLPFGAVLVLHDTGEVVAEGWNRSVENLTWHGEIDAINRCASAGPDIDWGRLTLYTTAEPCPMCMAAILWAGIPRVVFGTSIRQLQRLGWHQIDIPFAVVSDRGQHQEVLPDRRGSR